MRPAAREADHERVFVDPRQAAKRLLACRRDDLGAQVEQGKEVPEVAGEERHLVDPDHHDPIDARDQAGDLLDRRRARPCGRSRRGSRGRSRARSRTRCLPKREERRLRLARRAVRRGGVRAALVLVARGILKLGKAFEAKRLREAHDGRARRVGSPRQLLGGLERGLLEMVDDVARDVLLRAREVLEALTDVIRRASPRAVEVDGSPSSPSPLHHRRCHCCDRWTVSCHRGSTRSALSLRAAMN